MCQESLVYLHQIKCKLQDKGMMDETPINVNDSNCLTEWLFMIKIKETL